MASTLGEATSDIGARDRRDDIVPIGFAQGICPDGQFAGGRFGEGDLFHT